jgi:hypothetical protein
MTDGTTTDSTPQARRGWGSLIFWILTLLAFYVLSTGPMTRMAQSGLFEQSQLDTLYAPLGWAVTSSPAVERFFRWYLDVIWHCGVYQ